MPDRDFSHDPHARSSADLTDMDDEERQALADQYFAREGDDLIALFPPDQSPEEHERTRRALAPHLDDPSDDETAGGEA